MMKIINILIALILILTPKISYAEKDTLFWVAPVIQKNLNDNIGTWLEFQSRFKNDSSQVDRIMIRPGINYNVGNGITLWLGYAYAPFTIGTSSKFYDEHRIWQQGLHTLKIDEGVQLLSRLRFEQRFIENKDNIIHRVRYQERFVYRPKSWNNFGVAIWDEIFFNINTKDMFDQNRSAFGVQYVINKNIVLEPTYMLLIQSRENKDNLYGNTGLLFIWITL